MTSALRLHKDGFFIDPRLTAHTVVLDGTHFTRTTSLYRETAYELEWPEPQYELADTDANEVALLQATLELVASSQHWPFVEVLLGPVDKRVDR